MSQTNQIQQLLLKSALESLANPISQLRLSADQLPEDAIDVEGITADLRKIRHLLQRHAIRLDYAIEVLASRQPLNRTLPNGLHVSDLPTPTEIFLFAEPRTESPF